jgi:hypothetical protein
VRGCQREAVIGAATRIIESSVKVVCGRQHLAIIASAGLDDFHRDEALDIGAELREILCRRAGAASARSTTRCGNDECSATRAAAGTGRMTGNGSRVGSRRGSGFE